MCNTYVVHTFGKAHRFVAFDITPNDTTRKVNKCIVVEGEIGDTMVKCKLRINTCWITTFICECVTILTYSDMVVADRHADFESSLLVCFDEFTIL